MATVKIVLNKDTAYTGPKERGQVQITLSKLADDLINDRLIITPEIEEKEQTVTFRLPQEKINQLKVIAKGKNISVQSLLRKGMEQSSLLTHI